MLPFWRGVITDAFKADDPTWSDNPILRNGKDLQRIRREIIRWKDRKRQFVLFYEGADETRVIVDVERNEQHIRSILVLLRDFL